MKRGIEKKNNLVTGGDMLSQRLSLSGGDAVALCNICKWHPNHCHRLSFVFPKCQRNKSLICSADNLLIAWSAVPRGGRKDKSKGGEDFYL